MQFTDNNFVLLSVVKSIKVKFNDTLIVKDDILSLNDIEIIIHRVLDDGKDKAVEISVYGGQTHILAYTGYITFKPTEEEKKMVGYYIPYAKCKANTFARFVVNHLFFCGDGVEKKFEFKHEFKEDKKE